MLLAIHFHGHKHGWIVDVHDDGACGRVGSEKSGAPLGESRQTRRFRGNEDGDEQEDGQGNHDTTAPGSRRERADGRRVRGPWVLECEEPTLQQLCHLRGGSKTSGGVLRHQPADDLRKPGGNFGVARLGDRFGFTLRHLPQDRQGGVSPKRSTTGA